MDRPKSQPPSLTSRQAMISVKTISGQPFTFVAELEGREVGRVSVTVTPLVHDMEIEKGMLQRKIAEALFQYASGYVKASGFNEALVMVGKENIPMQYYVGARVEREAAHDMYLMPVK